MWEVQGYFESKYDISTKFGLLKGELFHKILESYLPINEIVKCEIPFSTTVYDIFGCCTKVITHADQNVALATAIRASCTFPILFAPVCINNRYYIDGGVFDDYGLMALPETLNSTHTIVNVVFENTQYNPSKIPSALLAKGLRVSLCIPKTQYFDFSYYKYRW